MTRSADSPRLHRKQGATVANDWLCDSHYEIIRSIDVMPIYEYTCASCGREFEKLVRQSSPAPECPDCHSAEVVKKLSAFATFSTMSGAGNSDLPAPCGSCGHPDGPGACRFN